jgi:hypothetical protein
MAWLRQAELSSYEHVSVLDPSKSFDFGGEEDLVLFFI